MSMLTQEELAIKIEAHREINRLKVEIDQLKEREKRAAELLRVSHLELSPEWYDERIRWMNDAGLEK
jgi:hypothetical protein